MLSSKPTISTPPRTWRPGAQGWRAASMLRSPRSFPLDRGPCRDDIEYAEVAVMAEYMVFIWSDEQAWERADPGAVEQTIAAHREFMSRHAAALRGSNRLHASGMSTSIRHAPDGGVAISDGAFAETKEVIGGYYLIEAADVDEALRIAADVPAPFGGVELRPVLPN